MGGEIEISVALPDRGLCGNGKAKGPWRTRLVAEQRRAAYLAGRMRVAPGEVWFPSGRVLVNVLVKRDPLWGRKKLDDDNFIRGLKATMDGLTDAGLVTNDSQFRWGDIEWEGADPYQGEVLLTLTPVEKGE